MSKLGLQEDEPSMLAPLDIKGKKPLLSCFLPSFLHSSRLFSIFFEPIFSCFISFSLFLLLTSLNKYGQSQYYSILEHLLLNDLYLIFLCFLYSSQEREDFNL